MWSGGHDGLLMWFIGVEAEQEKSAPPPKKNPGSAPCVLCNSAILIIKDFTRRRHPFMILVLLKTY